MGIDTDSRVLDSHRWRQFLDSAGDALGLHLTVVTTDQIVASAGTRLSSDMVELSMNGSQGFAFPLNDDSWVLGRASPHRVSTRPVRDSVQMAQRLILEFRSVLTESFAEGRKAVGISAIKQVNLIVLSLFQGDGRGDRSAVDRAIDLILSTLVVVLGAEGSWFSYAREGESRTLTKGDKDSIRRFLESAEGKAIEVPVRAKCCQASLGVTGVERTAEVMSLLSLLSQECVIVLEIDQLVRMVETRLRRILGGLGSAAMLVDSRRVYTYINDSAAQILGHAASEILGRGVSEIPAPWSESLRETGSRAVNGSMDRLSCGESVKWVDWTVMAIWEEKSVFGWVVVAEDRTDYHRWQEAAREAERLAATASSVGVLAHELRNPLAAAKGLLQLLERRHDPDRAAGYIGMAHKELDRATRLLNDFLLLGKPADCSLESLDLALFLEDLRPLLEGEALYRGLELKIECEPVPPVLLDASQFTQVLLNLVRNSCEAAGQGGRAIVRLRRQAGGVAVECLDNGPGLSREVLEKAFMPFFTTKERGTGLGLAVTRAIVHAHGGRIAAENLDGGGAVFRITLPPATGAGEASRIDVAVVVFDQVTRLACDHALRLSGLAVESAASLGSILRPGNGARPAVLVTDGSIPDDCKRAVLSTWPAVAVIALGEPPDYRDMVSRVHLELNKQNQR